VVYSIVQFVNVVINRWKIKLLITCTTETPQSCKHEPYIEELRHLNSIRTKCGENLKLRNPKSIKIYTFIQGFGLNCKK
jgi:hypothetical protein